MFEDIEKKLSNVSTKIEQDYYMKEGIELAKLRKNEEEKYLKIGLELQKIRKEIAQNLNNVILK